MRGTPGYIAPEWLMETGVSSKSDIYSLGIVLLEIMSGRRCVDLSALAEDCSGYPACFAILFLFFCVSDFCIRRTSTFTNGADGSAAGVR